MDNKIHQFIIGVTREEKADDRTLGRLVYKSIRLCQWSERWNRKSLTEPMNHCKWESIQWNWNLHLLLKCENEEEPSPTRQFHLYMYVYIYICFDIYAHTHIHIESYVYFDIYVCTYIYTHIIHILWYILLWSVHLHAL